MLTLHYAGFQPHASGFGWATCNANLRRELGKHFELVNELGYHNRLFDGEGRILPGAGNCEKKMCVPDIVFTPLADHDFNPAATARGRINFAYTFFEFPLGPNAKTNAAKYDIVFCGSTWCLERMREAGITNGEVLIQGVDQEIFHPPSALCPLPSAKSFGIFSGGKFEYRKGQDLVIAAFKKFAETHPDAHLVCSWFNPWPQLIRQALGEQIAPQWYAQPQTTLFNALLQLNGLRPDQFTILPQLSQEALAREMANTDIGLFPNRCEGGTNLVMMEYMACGRPVVANLATGHADLAHCIDWPIAYSYDADHWATQTIRSIEYAIGRAYEPEVREQRIEDRKKNTDRQSAISEFTWSRAACQIRDAASRSTGVLACGDNGHPAR